MPHKPVGSLPVYVGLAVTSRFNANEANAAFDSVTTVGNFITPSPTPTPTPVQDPNNLDGQGGVDLLDIIMLIQYIFDPTAPIAQGADPDINNDNNVNLLDVVTLIGIVFSN